MKRILIDAAPVVPYLASGRINGIGRTCLELITALNEVQDELPFEIALYTQNLRGVSAKRLGTDFKTVHAFLRHDAQGIKIANLLRTKEILGRYDLQHITHNYESVVDPSRCIVTIHDVMFFSYPEKHLGSERNRRIVPPFAHKAAHIITISENSKQEIMQYMNIPEKKISVIPWGINHKLLYPHSPGTNKWSGNEPYFASVSCDIGRKNTISVIRAYERFAQNSPRHHLILVWRNPTEEAIKLAERPKLRGKVHFASNLSNEQLADVYAGATATFFPSLYEGFGLPIAESMACGVPCVTAKNSSLYEIGGNAAIYTHPTDINALASEMEKFENNDYDMPLLREMSIKQAADFTWEQCAQRTINIYKQCLGLI